MAERLTLRLYNAINLDDNVPFIHIPVDSPEEALVIGMRMAKEQLERPEIESNIFGLQQWNEEEKCWDEWEDPDTGQTYDERWGESEALSAEIFGIPTR